MEKLVEYIPLFIIIASVIISIVRKAKGPMEEIMLPEEVFPVPQDPVMHEEQIPLPRIKSPAAPRISIPEKKQTIIYEKSDEIKDTGKYERGIDMDFSDLDEIKKAVIYSEILNRKDF